MRPPIPIFLEIYFSYHRRSENRFKEIRFFQKIGFIAGPLYFATMFKLQMAIDFMRLGEILLIF